MAEVKNDTRTILDSDTIHRQPLAGFHQGYYNEVKKQISIHGGIIDESTLTKG